MIVDVVDVDLHDESVRSRWKVGYKFRIAANGFAVDPRLGRPNAIELEFHRSAFGGLETGRDEERQALLAHLRLQFLFRESASNGAVHYIPCLDIALEDFGIVRAGAAAVDAPCASDG